MSLGLLGLGLHGPGWRRARAGRHAGGPGPRQPTRTPAAPATRARPRRRRPAPDGVVDSAGPYALRRLTLLEYQNTIRDLLGVDADRRGPARLLRRPGARRRVRQRGGHRHLDRLAPVPRRVDQGGRRGDRRPRPSCCRRAARPRRPDAELGCIEQVRRGVRAARLPPAAEPDRDRAGWSACSSKLRGAEVGATFQQAVHDVVLAFLQSPEFLYRWELDGAADQGRRPHQVRALRDRLAAVLLPVGLDARRRAVRRGQGGRAVERPERDRRPGRAHVEGRAGQGRPARLPPAVAGHLRRGRAGEGRQLHHLLARGGQGDAGRDRGLHRRHLFGPQATGKLEALLPRAPRSSTGRWPSTTASRASPATRCRRSTSTRRSGRAS